MSSNRRQVPLNKKKMVKIAIVITIVLAVLLVLMQVLKKKVGDEFGNEEEIEVLTAEVTMGSISTTISGSGSLEYEEADEVSIPQTVEINEIYVQAGDTVKEGDILASVNSASVVTAMNEVQEELDTLDEELSEVSEEDAEDKITAGVDGRVKKIYVKDEEDVADAMYDHQALMLISVDGYMAVDVSTDALTKGEEVTVKTSGGKKYTGTVDSVWVGSSVMTSMMAEEEEAPSYVLGETTLCALTPDDGVKVDITIDELDILAISMGQECEITMDAFPGQSFAGKVSGIGQSGTNSGGNAKYTVTISMTKETDMLLGMNASVRLVMNTEKDVLIIPEEALVEQEGKVFVYTEYDEKTDELDGITEVATGLSDGQNVQITEGLESGQEYCYRYADTISYSFVR